MSFAEIDPPARILMGWAGNVPQCIGRSHACRAYGPDILQDHGRGASDAARIFGKNELTLVVSGTGMSRMKTAWRAAGKWRRADRVQRRRLQRAHAEIARRCGAAVRGQDSVGPRHAAG
jgi:hypothetical protein